MKVTKQQLFDRYLEAGMPEVYAAMAADENCSQKVKGNASKPLMSNFVWDKSVMGDDFWFAIFTELAYENQ